MDQYASYTDSLIPYVGLIPSHWKTVQNKRVMHKEKRICTSYAGQDIISLTMNGVVIRDLGAGGKMPTTFDGYQFVYPGELLMCLFDIDVTPRCVGKVYNEGLTSPAYSSFVLHDNADLGFYYYYYLMLDHTKELLHLAKNLRHSLTEEQLGQIKVPLPPLSEQRAIAEFLEAKVAHIDSVIAEAKASIEEYKAWKASIIYEAVTKGLDPSVEMKDSGIEWIGYMPTKWSRTKLSNCFNIVGSGTTPTSDDDSYYIGNINWLQSGDINGGIVNATKKQVSEEAYDKFSALKVYKAPFMAIAMYGASIANTSIVQVDACTNQACCVFSAPNEFIVLEYVFYAVLGAKEELLLSARGGTQPNINQDILKKLMIPIPSKSEQEYIVCSLNFKCGKINELIAEKETLISDLEAYKKSLIFEVVTGKRKVV